MIWIVILQLPIPPQMKTAAPLKKVERPADEGFEVLSSEEANLAPVVGKDSGLLVQLETDLLTQLNVIHYDFKILLIQFNLVLIFSILIFSILIFSILIFSNFNLI